MTHVLQGAYIRVNESGTEAAAATVARMQTLCAELPKPQFRVDRPFMYAIVDNATALPLFWGAVSDPSRQ